MEMEEGRNFYYRNYKTTSEWVIIHRHFIYLPTSWNYNYGNPNTIYAQNIWLQQLSNGNVLFAMVQQGFY
jgi:hypothetical protein